MLAARIAVLAFGLAAVSCSAQPAGSDVSANSLAPPAPTTGQAAATAAAPVRSASGWSVSRDARGCMLEGPSQFANLPVGAEDQPPLLPWSTGTMSWSGACVAGKADGVGVARMLAGGKPAGVWYGRAVNGRIGLGVIVDGHGNFDAVDGTGGTVRVLEADEAGLARRTEARETARGAILAYVASLTAAGNAGSADYYRRQMEVVDAMDQGE